nr:hypothetical protein [uncultured Fusobacterium sp.]
MKRHSFEIQRKDGKPIKILMDEKELNGVVEVEISSTNSGERAKDSITITFIDIESLKITNL